MKKKATVAIVYDRVNKWGGAERVLLALHEIFPDAPLYTSVYDKKDAPWASAFPLVSTSFLQKLPFARSNHEFLAPLMPLAFESLDLTGFDLVISVTSEFGKAVKTGPKTLHICYCLTPTRYLWSHHDEYFKGVTFKGIAKPIVNLLRKWDKKAARRPDVMIAISTEVKNRIKKYYGRNSQIIFPPVNATVIRSAVAKQKGEKMKKYYLIVSRLVEYKRADLAITAFNKLSYPLIIIGTGREEKKLKRSAGENVHFVGKVSEKALTAYYSGAKALIMPQEEDFGIVAVEAQSFGVPVIAFKKGGALDTVIQGKTGVFFEKQNSESLINAVKKFERMKFAVSDLHANANKFSKKVFRTKVLDLLNKYNRI